MDDKKNGFDISDTEELAQVLDTVGEKVPKLIRDILGSLYNKEAGTNMGQAVGAYYKELVDAGIPQEAALEMAKEFSFSLRNFMDKNAPMKGGADQPSNPRKGFSFHFGDDPVDEG